MRSLAILSLCLVFSLSNTAPTITIYGGVQYTGQFSTFTSADFRRSEAELEEIPQDGPVELPPHISSYKLQEGLLATFCYQWSVQRTCIRSCQVVGPVNVPDTLGFKLSWSLIGLQDIDLYETSAVNLFSGQYFTQQSAVFFPGEIFFGQLQATLGVQVYQPPKPKGRKKPWPPAVIVGALAYSMQIPGGVTVQFFKEDNFKGAGVPIVGPRYLPVGGIPGFGPTFKSMRIIKDLMPNFRGAWLLAASGTGTIQQTISMGTSHTQGQEISREQSTAMSKSVTKSFGFSLFGFSSEKSTTVTNAVANSVGNTMSNYFATTFQYTCNQVCENDDPSAITYMFQWAMNSDRVPQLGDVTSYSCNTLCKKSPEPPKCPLTACLDAECQKCSPWEANPSVAVEHESEEEQLKYFKEVEEYLKSLEILGEPQVEERENSFMQ